MGKWILYGAAIAAVVLCTTVYGGEPVTFEFGGNNAGLDTAVLFGDPNEGMVGPWGSWSRKDTDHVWGAGLRGELNVSAQVKGLLDNPLTAPPESWWKLLQDLGAKTLLTTDVGVVDFTDPEGTATPGFKLVLGPLYAGIGYRFFEGGEIKRGGRLIADDGIVYTIGVVKTW